MGIKFNADEVFEMAEQIEINGASFYKKAAEKFQNKEGKEMLLLLADQEAQHLVIFREMRQSLSDKEKENAAFDPDKTASAYLKALAEHNVFKEDKKIVEDLSEEEIIKTAIVLEKESIAFYLGMKDYMPQKLGKNKLDDIIKEEMRHVVFLVEKLSKYAKKMIS